MAAARHFLVLLAASLLLPLAAAYVRCAGNFSAAAVCPGRLGLAFTDGCNRRRCVGADRVASTSRACSEQAEEVQYRPRRRARITAYCAAVRTNLTQRMRERPACLAAAWTRFCAARPSGAFVTGCQRCRCHGPDRKQCAALDNGDGDRCRPERGPKFVTDAEFNRTCAREIDELLERF